MPLKVTNVTYNNSDLTHLPDAAAWLSSGHLGDLFGDTGKRWKFANVSIFLQTLAVLGRTKWTRDKAVHSDAALRFAAPEGQERAGTVVIGQGFGKPAATFDRPDALAAHPALALLADGEVARDVRLGQLAADPVAQRWEFADVNELRAFLAGWTQLGGQPQDWPADHRSTAGLLAHRVPVLAESVKDRYEPTKTQLAKKQLQDIWNNCGNAARHLIGRIHDLGRVEKSSFVVLRGPQEKADIVGLLTRPIVLPSLIHISNPILHEFVIERHPDGRAVLQQGYQNAYGAPWWAGLEGVDSSEFTLTGPAAANLRDHRDNYGKSQIVDLTVLGKLLAAFLVGRTIRDDPSHLAWRALPFQSLDNTNDSAVPEWQITVWTIHDYDAARAALAKQNIVIDQQQPWLTTAVLKEAAQFWKTAT